MWASGRPTARSGRCCSLPPPRLGPSWCVAVFLLSSRSLHGGCVQGTRPGLVEQHPAPVLAQCTGPRCAPCARWAPRLHPACASPPSQVNINPAYRASELAYALGQAGVSVLVLAPGLRGGRGFVEMAESVRKQTPQLRLRLLLAEEGLPEGGLVWGRCWVAGGGSVVCAYVCVQRWPVPGSRHARDRKALLPPRRPRAAAACPPLLRRLPELAGGVRGGAGARAGGGAG